MSDKSDEDFVEKRRIDHIYVSKPFPIGMNEDHEARYICRVFDADERSTFDVVNGEIVLRSTYNDKVQLKALVSTDEDKMQRLTLQTFRIHGDGIRPEKQNAVTLKGAEIAQLLQFAELATKLRETTPGRVRLAGDALGDIDLDDSVREWIAQNPDAVKEIVENELTSSDVVSLAYRRRELKRFERYLTEPDFFDSEVHLTTGEEAVWQQFFERNRWIFGYGLFYLSADGFKGKKLEQLVAGSTLATHGKRADALLKTRGRVSSACLVEIKRHRTALLKPDHYRSGAWQPTTELAGAVAQTQATVDALEKQFQQLLVMKDATGNPTGEEAVIARPRSVVVCGSSSEFVTEGGINLDRFRSFELYRRNLLAPDVITFDELYERASLIVESTET